MWGSGQGAAQKNDMTNGAMRYPNGNPTIKAATAKRNIFHFDFLAMIGDMPRPFAVLFCFQTFAPLLLRRILLASLAASARFRMASKSIMLPLLSYEPGVPLAILKAFLLALLVNATERLDDFIA